MRWFNWFKSGSRNDNVLQDRGKRDTGLAETRDRKGNLLGTHVIALGLRANRDFPHLIYCTFAFRGTPLPTVAEFERFDIIQDRIDNLALIADFIEVGIMTIEGKRDYLLYARDGQAALNSLFTELSEFSPQMERQYDPKWSQYNTLMKMLNLR